MHMRMTPHDMLQRLIHIHVLISPPTAVLQTDPADVSRAGGHPSPLHELDFWSSKSQDLASLHAQLQSDKMCTVLDTLNELKSPFAAQFEKLTRDVVVARDESAENSRFLATLKPYFQRINDESDFTLVEQTFVPIMHTILLIWQHSHTYNTKPRLICLIQEICNALILQVREQHCCM